MIIGLGSTGAPALFFTGDSRMNPFFIPIGFTRLTFNVSLFSAAVQLLQNLRRQVTLTSPTLPTFQRVQPLLATHSRLFL